MNELGEFWCNGKPSRILQWLKNEEHLLGPESDLCLPAAQPHSRHCPFPPHLHMLLPALDSTSNTFLPPAPASHCAGLGALSHVCHWHAHHGTLITSTATFTHLSSPCWTMNLRRVLEGGAWYTADSQHMLAEEWAVKLWGKFLQC